MVKQHTPSSKLKAGLSILFLAALTIQPIAAVLSPQFPTFLSGVLKDRSRFLQEQEALRRATPLWSKAVGLYNTALYRIGVSGSPQAAMVGQDGWAFLGNMHVSSFDQATKRRVASDAEVDQWIQILQYEAGFAARRGIPFLYVVAPAQSTIYPDKLPAWTGVFKNRQSTFDRVAAAAKARNLPLIDLRQALRNGRSTAETYSPLNSHWNDYGVWVAWQRIAAEIGRQKPGATMAALSPVKSFQTVDAYSEFGPMLGIAARNPWIRPVLAEPFPQYYSISPNGSRTLHPGTQSTGLLDLPRRTETPGSASNLRALVLRDSMGDSLSPYLQASFRETYQFNHHITSPQAPFNIPGYIAEYKPDLIIYVMTERYFLLPLGDTVFWKAADTFDRAPVASEQIWPNAPGTGTIEFAGDVTVSKPTLVKLPAGTANAKSRVFKVSLQAEADGALYISYVVAGKTVENWHAFGSGISEIYVQMPSAVDGEHIWMARDTTKGSLTLKQLALRAEP